jgi:hypothetical protein
MWTYRLKKDPTKTVTIRDANLKSLLEREGFELFNEIKKNVESKDIEVEKETKKDTKIKTIETLLKGNFMKMKYGLSKYTEENKNLIYEVASEISTLSKGKNKFVSEFCGKPVINTDQV